MRRWGRTPPRRDQLARDCAGLFAQLAQGGGGRVLADVVELAGRDLGDDLAHGIAELVLEQHVAVFQQREDANRAVVDSIFARGLLAVRQADGILEDVQHVAVKDRLGRKLRFL